MSLFPQYVELKTNFEELGAVATKSFTVPTGKRWIVFGGYVERDNGSTTVDIGFYNSADHLIMAFAQIASGSSEISWGTMATALVDSLYQPLPLDAGSYVKYTWSGAQTSPLVTCYIAEYPK